MRDVYPFQLTMDAARFVPIALLCCAVRVEAMLEPQAGIVSVQRRHRTGRGRYYASDQLACEQQLLGDGKERRVELDEDKYAELTSADSDLFFPAPAMSSLARRAHRAYLKFTTSAANR